MPMTDTVAYEPDGPVGMVIPRGPLSFGRLLKKAHLRRWPARAALRRTDQVRLAPRLARRLASGPF
jgi:hypothetical protein